ncbi:MAG: hypothetical protein IJR82_02525 [Bacilli bacterium]|nr:hypothetical protein [Bacilli bacterium]
MKTNISALMGLISEEERYLKSKCYTIGDYAINTSVEELDGRINIIEDNKEDFDLDLKEIERSVKELSRLKAILYEKNNQFKLNDGRCIQQAIVDNTNLRKLKSTYEELLVLKNSKKRVTEVNNSYFECKTVNFDSKQLRERLEQIDNAIQKTDFEISKLNSVEFEI